MFLVSSCSYHCLNQWSQVFRQKWRYPTGWSSADRPCSNYIWVINNLLPTKVRLILHVWWYFSTQLADVSHLYEEWNAVESPDDGAVVCLPRQDVQCSDCTLHDLLHTDPISVGSLLLLAILRQTALLWVAKQKCINSLAPGRCGCNFKWLIFKPTSWISWAFPVKLASGECYKALWIISQHWVR